MAKRLHHRGNEPYYTQYRQWPTWMLVVVYGGAVAAIVLAVAAALR